MKSDKFRLFTLTVFLLVINGCNGQYENFGITEKEGADKCYEGGKPKKCQPEFVNAAFNVAVEVTSTCGDYSISEYCIRSGAMGVRRECNWCDDRDPARRHPASYLTDFNNNENETWWQSQTMYEKWPNQVNLTLSLGKAFDIVYIRLKFHSPRPESFAIYKKTSEDGDWIPYQFYSATCRDFYSLPESTHIRTGSEARAMCNSEFSDISPLTGGNVAFSTLEGRPSALQFVENSKELQEWVTATDIRITLDRMNTFGDEVFEDPKVLKSYFYAITDLAVGGTCKCNGHASECITSSGDNGDRRMICRCEHNTAGPDCNKCLPFYNDQPWGVATQADAHECQPCNCNGFSDVCHFDQKLYDETGHGGYCDDCRGNRAGPRCELCKPNHFQRSDGICVPCYCNEIGSRSLQCNSQGKCQCKPGVAGDKCDKCESNFYDFGQQGCKPCSCNEAGSFRNHPDCDVKSGTCRCKDNVEGQLCDTCKPGFFNLETTNDFGCTPCFCFGHSGICNSAQGYGQVLIESFFTRGNERWNGMKAHSKESAPIQYYTTNHNIALNADGREPVYFIAPDRFLGDQRGSYNHVLNFTFRIGESNPKPSTEDIILEGAGLRIARPIFGNRNNLPSTTEQEFSFRLHEHADFGWNPRLTSRDFISVLSNLTAIKIRGTYTPKGIGFLDNVKLQTARRGAGGEPATWIESCACPEGYIGQFCESCAPGYTHEPPNGGPFARCVPCNCNGHSEMCDPESGQCICHDDTAGENCERCKRGYYGNALAGTDEDCKPCPCPNNGACIQLPDNTVVCLECPAGYAGPLCEFCGDGYFGDPLGKLGPATECQPCECNENIDLNAVGNCNRTTGECLKCIYNTGGPRCDQCLPGFFGDALASTKGDCKPCECNNLGTVPTPNGAFVCEQPSGQCPCKANVIGRQCDACETGYYDLASGNGCQECSCDPVGSHNSSCNIRSGQCHCRNGIVGLRCSNCAPSHYGFSNEGCKPCACDSVGSLSLQCTPEGQCPCKSNVEGRACDRCKENKFNREAGCVDCPFCYNIVQDAVNEHKKTLNEMDKLLEDIANTPTVIDDSDFETKLKQVQQRVNQMWTDARAASGDDGRSLLEKVNELRQKILSMDDTANSIRISVDQCEKDADMIMANITLADETVNQAENTVRQAMRFLDTDGKNALTQAQEKAAHFGEKSQSLSELAREARVLADVHEASANTIEETAQKALNTSTEAYEIAYNAYNTQRNASEESRQLLSIAQQLEEQVKEAEEQAQLSLTRAKAAYDEALTLFKNSMGLNLPLIDLEEVRNKAKAAKADAMRLKNTVQQLLTEREQILREAKEIAESTKVKVENAQQQQQNAEELLADLDKAKRSAEEARDKSETTFKAAEQIYATLQDFHRNIEESKDNATAAKEKIPAIRQFIQDAREQTRSNVILINSAKEAASKALKDAEEAKAAAMRAAEEADTIRDDCKDAKNTARELKDETIALKVRIADTGSRLATAEEKVQLEESQVDTALLKASEAASKTHTTFQTVQNALAEVRDISLALENLEQINEDGLKNLEAKVSALDRAVKQSGIDAKLEQLREARNKQAAWIKSSEDEVEALKKEVANIREIKDTLPPETRCWNRLRLEP